MRRNLIPELLLLLLTAGLVTASGQWDVLGGSVLPQDIGDPWEESNSTVPDDNATQILSVIDDPAIPGNKLIKVDTAPLGAGFKEQWKVNWGGDATTGMTLVLRAAALDTAVYDRDLDVYIYNGYGGERLITATKGSRVKFDRSGIETYITPMNMTEFHILRITAIADQFELYIDEDPLSYLVATGVSTADQYFRFGDGGSSLHGALYDWIAWDTTGAYAPGQGTPLPDSLATTVAIDERTHLYPLEFTLYQNFPNPFNPHTEIHYRLQETALVRLEIYNLRGELVSRLINAREEAGFHQVQWDGRDRFGNLLPSGVYIYSLNTDNRQATRRMHLIK